MIGTHNSLSSARPRYGFFNLFIWLWRCQTQMFGEQLLFAHYFDIRIRFDKEGRLWFCHGIVDFDTPWTLDVLLKYVMRYKATCRVVIERGKVPADLMVMLAPYLSCIHMVIVKKGWRVIYKDREREHLKFSDTTYVPFRSDRTFWQNLVHLKISTIKIWARRHNPPITQKLREDDVIHFLDHFVM